MKQRKDNMKQEEDIIRNMAGKDNAFKVPDNYFADFTRRMMDRIDAEDANRDPSARTAVKPIGTLGKVAAMWKPLAACAACTVASVISVAIHLNGGNDSAAAEMAEVQTTNAKDAADIYMDDVIDFAMMDNADIVACLSEE